MQVRYRKELKFSICLAKPRHDTLHTTECHSFFSVCVRTYNKEHVSSQSVVGQESRGNGQRTREMLERDRKKKLADR